jgi:cyanate permease
MTGITGANQNQSNAVSNHEMEAYKADQAAKAAMYSGLAQAAGSILAAPMTGGTSLAGAGLSKLGSLLKK